MSKANALLLPLLLFVLLSSEYAYAADSPVQSPKPGAIYREVSTVEELYKAVSELGTDGGTIQLRPGNYVLDTTIEVRNKNLVYIQGSGWNSIITKRGEGNVFLFDSCSFCVVRDLLVQGDAAAKAGSGIVFAGNSSSCTVDFCRMSGFATYGIDFAGSAASQMSSNTVRDCHFISNKQAGLYSCYNNDFYLVRNQFGASGDHPKAGCVLDNSSAGTYSMNYHWNNVNALIIGPGANFNRIENNRFEESEGTGVILGDPNRGGSSAYNIITGNTFHTNSKSKSGEFPAMAAHNSVDITLTSNQFFSWDSARYKHKNSLLIGKGCSDWIVKDNIFHDNVGDAVVYDKGISILIKDNITK